MEFLISFIFSSLSFLIFEKLGLTFAVFGRILFFVTGLKVAAFVEYSVPEFSIMMTGHCIAQLVKSNLVGLVEADFC